MVTQNRGRMRFLQGETVNSIRKLNSLTNAVLVILSPKERCTPPGVALSNGAKT
jgi:hypothetical protein